MNAVALLSEIIAQSGKASTSFYRDHPALAALLRHEYLKESGVLASVVCDDCDEPHAARVTFEDGEYGHICPNIGFVLQDRSDLLALQPDLPLLVERLSQALDCRKTKASPLHGQTWRIGAVAQDAGELMLYFHPCLQSEDHTRDLEQAFSHEVRSQWRLIITASGALPLASAQVVRLNDLADIDTDTGELRIVAEPSDLAGMPRKNTGGRPSEHGALLSTLIAARNQFGATLSGRNAEARALLFEFKKEYPDRTPPSISTIKDHVTKSRSGQ